jgi:hypothetical protein
MLSGKALVSKNSSAASNALENGTTASVLISISSSGVLVLPFFSLAGSLIS